MTGFRSYRQVAGIVAFLAMAIPGTGLVAQETAILAGGCYWCVESDFDSVDGVVSTTSGFIGGKVDNPSYKQVTKGKTGHYEAVLIEYDPEIVSYRELLDLFFRSIDPTDPGGQFCDRGDAYRTAVFVNNPEERKIAREAKRVAQADLGKRVVTQIHNAGAFWPGPDNHQDYYLGTRSVLTRFGLLTQAEAYKRYRKSCGRDKRVKDLWGDAAPFVH